LDINNDVCLQWGSNHPTNNGQITITLPISYKQKAHAFIASTDTDDQTMVVATIRMISMSQFYAACALSNTGMVNQIFAWFTIGY